MCVCVCVCVVSLLLGSMGRAIDVDLVVPVSWAIESESSAMAKSMLVQISSASCTELHAHRRHTDSPTQTN